MSINRLIIAGLAFLMAEGALYTPACADGYREHSDFALHHCRDYGGVITANGGCYISSKKQRKRLVYDELAWQNARQVDHHHRHHDEFDRDHY